MTNKESRKQPILKYTAIFGAVALAAGIVGMEIGDHYNSGPSDWVFGDDDREGVVTVEEIPGGTMVTPNPDGTYTLTQVDGNGRVLATFIADDIYGTNAKMVTP